jgi:imidazolonepropionase-like amidohydrolase
MRITFLLLSLAASLAGQCQLAFVNTTVVDVEKGKLLPEQTVLVQGSTIAAMGSRLTLPPGTRVIDGRGKYLMPGLVDAHIHFFQSGGMYTRPDVIDLRKYQPYSREVEWTHLQMESQLRRYAAAGITTVIDVGATVNFLKQRDTFRGKTYAPAIYMTGPLLTTWEPPAFKDLKDDAPFAEMKTEEDARRLVRQQLPYKPDFIKIWYIVQGRNTDSAARARLPLVKAAIEEAHGAGLRVAVHATERITAQLAVEAGADYLVHGIDDEPITPGFARLLKQKGVVLSPTLVVMNNYIRALGQQYRFAVHDHQLAHPAPLRSLIDFRHLPDSTIPRRYKTAMEMGRSTTRATDSLLRANLKVLAAEGVLIATGTDAGNIGTQHAASYVDELLAMQEAGLSPWQLLQASTINGARAVGKEALFGSVRPGKTANLLLLNSNPLDSIGTLNRPALVIQQGEPFHPDSLRRPTPEELAEQQLLAYNAHNLEAFLAPYAEDVEVYSFPNKLEFRGKETMRKAYGFIERTPGLYCRLQSRIVQGNRVIDHEEVWGFGKKPVYAIAIYEIEGGKIRKVYFME